MMQFRCKSVTRSMAVPMAMFAVVRGPTIYNDVRTDDSVSLVVKVAI